MQAQTCPECGVRLPEQAALGLCAACELTGALALSPTLSPPPEHRAGTQTRDATSPTSPRQFANYELLEEIARGGMGVVYKARQLDLNRTVALKMILASRLASPAAVQRFCAEAQTAARLQHPNIVAIHETGQHEGQPYFSMDYVAGSNLSELVRNHPLPPSRAAQLLRTIAEAVHYAHQQGILHRDLKPSNILIDASGQPRITDFGLAKHLQAESDLTLSGQVLGSPHFISPEQALAKHQELGPPSDIYSLGAILYQLLSARPPFVADSIAATLRMVCETDPVPLRSLNPGLPVDLETICLKCLEKDPAKRYHTALELAEDLGRFLRDEPIRARAVRSTEKLWRWCRRNPALAAMAATTVLSLVAIALGASVAAWRIAQARARETAQWQRAEQEKLRAEARTLTARQNLYAAEMLLAQQALAEKNLGRALEFLDRNRPGPGQADLRGWEWSHLRALCRSDELFTLVREPKGVAKVAYSPDGRRIAWADRESTIRLWDLASRRELAAYTSSSPVHEPCFSPDGKWLAFATWSDPPVLLHADTLEPAATLSNHALVVAFSPDSHALYAANLARIQRLDLTTRTGVEKSPIQIRFNSQARNDHAAFSRDAGMLALATLGDGVQLWDLASQSQAGSFPVQGQALPFRLAFSPDRKLLAVAYTDNTVGLWSVETQRLLATLAGHSAFVTSMAFSPDGHYLATGSYDQTIVLWNAATGQKLRHYQGHLKDVSSIDVSPDGTKLASASLDNTLRIWDLTAPPRRSTATNFDYTAYVCVLAPDSQILITRSLEGTLKLWNTEALQPSPFPAPALLKPCGIAVSTDATAVATGAEDGSIQFWFRTNNQFNVLRTIQGHSQEIKLLAFSPDGHLLASAGADHDVVVWEVGAGREFTRLPPSQSIVDSLAFSPAGNIVGASYFDRTVTLWHVAEKRELARLRGHTGSILGIAIAHHGKLAATAGFDRSVRLWDLTGATGAREIASSKDHLAPLWSVAFSPDDRRLAIGTGDGQVRIWSTETHQDMITLKGHKFPVFAVGFVQKSQTLVSVSGDALCLWHAALLEPETEEPAALAGR